MTIRISHGDARVELDGGEVRNYGEAVTRALYVTDDLLEACRRALLAAGDDRADALGRLIYDKAAR